jgi:hypothetical protein
MNKLTKIGLSSLCGSLAALSAANAGEMSVTGGATVTHSSNSGDVDGNNLGMNSGLTFVGSGELDNGTTFTLTLTNADKAAYSAGSLAIVTPSMGSFTVGQANGGNGIDAYDDKMPTAWEETWGTSLGTGLDLVSGVGASMNIQYKTPVIAGTTLAIAHSASNDGGLVNDKSTSGAANAALQRGTDVALDINVPYVNVFAGYSITERYGNAYAAGTNNDKNSDREEGVAGALITIGPVVLGAQATAEFTGAEQTGSDVFGYKNVSYGVAFNISDNLSISYGNVESTQGFVSQDGGASGKPSRKMEIDSYQIAYTMGGASIKIAESEVSNAKYQTGTGNTKEATTIALSLAF